MTSREAFEEWARGSHENYPLLRDSDEGFYLDSETWQAWNIWQAATERAARVARDEMKRCGGIGSRVIDSIVDAIREGGE